MSFDNLTLTMLAVFAIALGGFIYACIIRNCISERPHKAGQPGNDSAASGQAGSH